jgi:hypothetical protein
MFREGDFVTLTPDAVSSYGFGNTVFRVTHVATRYMKSQEFFSSGQPKGYHPGFDPNSGKALFELQAIDGREFNNSVYEWELRLATDDDFRLNGIHD